MFAFAIWDARRRKLLLARDRLGIKPLYYAEIDGGIAFASELKPILQLPEVGRQLDWEAVGHLFTFLATPSSQSIVDGVRKLEPGRVATVGDGRALRIERYWDVEFDAGRDVQRGRAGRAAPGAARRGRAAASGQRRAGRRLPQRRHRLERRRRDDGAADARTGQDVLDRVSPRRTTTSSRMRVAWRRPSAPSITSWCCGPTSSRLSRTSPGISTSRSATRRRFRPTWCRSSRPST